MYFYQVDVSMNNKYKYFFAGLILGSVIAFFFTNRYEPISFDGKAGRLDKFTGNACIFLDDTNLSNEYIKRWYGAPACN